MAQFLFILFSFNYFHRDGKEIRSTMNTKLIQEDKTCILKTSKFSQADIGTYKCVATNSAGTAECEAKVEGRLNELEKFDRNYIKNFLSTNAYFD